MRKSYVRRFIYGKMSTRHPLTRVAYFLCTPFWLWATVHSIKHRQKSAVCGFIAGLFTHEFVAYLDRLLCHGRIILILKAAAHYAIRRAECRVRGGETATFGENGATFRLGGRRNSKSRRRMSLTGVSAEMRKKAEPVQLFSGMSRRRTRTAARQTFSLFDATTVWPFGESTHGCKVQI